MANPLISASIDRWLLDPRYRSQRYGLYWATAGLLLLIGFGDSLWSVTERVQPAARACAYAFEIGYAVAVLGAIALNLFVLIPRLLLNERKRKLYLAWVVLVSLLLSGADLMPFGYKTQQPVTLSLLQLGLEVCEGTVFVGSLLISIAVLKLLKGWIDEREHIRQLQTDSLRNELAALKAQVNPHFLFNTLNNIHTLAKLHSPLTADAILSLSDLMRYQLYEGIGDCILLEHEMQCVENLLALERLRRQPPDLDVQLKVRGLKGQLIAPFLLLPFVENAFKHGSASAVGAPSFIHLTLEADQTGIRFRIENSYVGSHPSTGTGGIGLVNVRRRLTLLYPGRHELDIHQTQCRFTVDLRLALSTDQFVNS